MTLQQRRKALIHWINDLDDEAILAVVENLKHSNVQQQIPAEIENLLKLADEAEETTCIPHARVKSLLERR